VAPHRILITIPLLALACAQGTKAELPAEPASISGQITSVNRAGEKIGSIRVEAQPKDSSGSAKAVARIGQETTILRVGGGAGEFNSLAEGQWVRVWFSGPVAQSYPVQATATVVMIDSLPR
jgi:beta-N-acetylhexosaminidase